MLHSIVRSPVPLLRRRHATSDRPAAPHPHTRLPRQATPDAGHRTTALWVLALGLVGLSAWVFWPLAAALLLATWLSSIARPHFLRLSKKLRGRQKAAGVLTSALVLALITPVILAATMLVPAAKSLFEQLKAAPGTKGLLAALVSNGGAPKGGGIDVIGLAKQYGESAATALGIVASASAEIVAGLFVFLTVFYALLVDGERAFAWLRSRLPLAPEVTQTLAQSFHQAGRGLLMGTGMTALIQGTLAGILYAALGVPRAFLLGMLSVIGALIPVTGPAIVWLPVAAGLFLTGQPGKAAILVALSVAVVGTVDNLLRPWLSKRADIGLPGPVVLVAIFGGLAVFGAWGLLFGPLIVRLAASTLDILRTKEPMNA